jgi:hypothetical protein
MMKKTLIMITVGMFLAMTVGSVYALEVFTCPTEVLQYNPTKAYNGYTVFAPAKGWTVDLTPYYAYLIDMEGNVVNEWLLTWAPGYYPRLTEDGYMIYVTRDPAALAADTAGILGGPGCSGIEMMDWDGNVVLSIEYFSADHNIHHDLRRIYNKALGEYTYLVVSSERKGPDDALNLGADPATSSTFENGWSVDVVAELNSSGEVIWRWSLTDHCVQNYDPNITADFTDVAGRFNAGPTYGEPEDYPEKLDTNYRSPRRDWIHVNSMDYNDELGHIVWNSVHGQIFVFDHDGTFVANDPEASMANAAGPAGDFLYRWGNPCWYNQGTCPYYPGHNEPANFGNKDIGGSHDIQYIKPAAYTGGPALPGAGNFLIFNNGGDTGVFSEIFEIDPYVEGQYGVYLPEIDAGYANNGQSNQIIWNYRSTMNNSFYSSYISGCQRLPNGNTLICSGATGHLFEVTYDTKEVVWEYINPVSMTGVKNVQTDADGMMSMSVFRALRYGPDFPTLVGKDLTPKGKLTERAGVEALQDKLEALTAQ